MTNTPCSVELGENIDGNWIFGSKSQNWFTSAYIQLLDVMQGSKRVLGIPHRYIMRKVKQIEPSSPFIFRRNSYLKKEWTESAPLPY